MTEKRKVKVREGVVVSDKMDKTVVIKIVKAFRHPLYQKTVKISNKFKAHDENNECHVGDLVKIMETRPLSKDKRWRVVQILTKAKPTQVKEALKVDSES